MDPEHLKEAWQSQASQAPLTTDAERILEEVRRKDREFDSTIFWRDVREIGVSVILVPVWLGMGASLSLPWTWYLMIPGLLWIAGYMLADRKYSRRKMPGPDAPLRQHVEGSLAQVEHQIWLLRNVAWWYLLPIGLPMLAFFAQVTWNGRSAGWLMAIPLLMVIGFVTIVFAGIYKVNQYAVRASLEPRRLELEALRASLADETPDAR
jgi:hypothetical protein